jgi:hypothetical protein
VYSWWTCRLLEEVAPRCCGACSSARTPGSQGVYAVGEEQTHQRRDVLGLVDEVLEAAPGGTQLTMTESGFDRIPLKRRAKAFTANESGWEHQSRRIEQYLMPRR